MMRLFSDYQQETSRTFDLTVSNRELIAQYALGLAGEAGEVADVFKKILFYKKPLDRDALVKEFGDVLWYLSALSLLMGIPLEEVARTNVEKLRARYPEGFDAKRALAKAENSPALPIDSFNGSSAGDYIA